jgi:rhodanese-related sulfurtransferase
MERRWPLERVIFALAGSMTLLSVVLALFVSPWFLLLTVFVGLNQWLFVAAGWCPLLQRGDAHLLDLRTQVERRRYGAPPGALAVSLARYILKPEGEGAIYLCQHAVRSKATLRNGAAEAAGGFVAWRRAGLPVNCVE